MSAKSKERPWLLPAVLVLILLQGIFFPLAVGITYSQGSQSPDHTLTYTTGKLTWDSATDIKPNGVAELSLFSDAYTNVQSSNGDRVIAPGTEGYQCIRLQNKENYEITYVAVMYEIKENEELPVKTTFSASGSLDTTKYPLPDGVSSSQVMRAVTGEVEGYGRKEFEIDWLWEYEVSDEQDQKDTALGDKAAFDVPDDITVGIYIVVEEDRPDGRDPDGGDPDPEKPVDPDHPDNPDNPEEPDNPENPDNPKNPEIPQDPTQPEPPIDHPSLPDASSFTPEQEEVTENPSQDGRYLLPQVPKTGDDSPVLVYLGLMVLSGVVFLFLVVEEWRDRACKKRKREG